MRVVGGSLGGRRFNPPANKWPTRPTTDIAKEALFNILQFRIDFSDIKALDLFGGSGSQCYELYSRGCTDITYVDRHYACIKFVKAQLVEFKATEAVKVIKSDVFKFLKATDQSFDYIFCDPPYALSNLVEIPDLIFDNALLMEDGLLVVEHDKHTSFQDHPRFEQERKYGETLFSFLK